MASIIITNTFGNRFRAETTGALIAVIGERITCTVNLSILWAAVGSGDTPLVFADTNKGFLNPTEVVYSADALFTDFKTGDVVDITDAGANDKTAATIIKIDDFTIRIIGAGFTYASDSNAKIVGTNAIEEIGYEYGLVENSETANFNSKIDGSLQRFYAVSVDCTDTTTVITMKPQGVKSWQHGDCTIIGAGLVDGAQNFTIVHTFQFLPLYLDGQYDDIVAGIAPDYFKDQFCLKYVNRIEAYLEANNPNSVLSQISSELLGNTGWFNELFNNKATNYSVLSCIHKNTSAAVIQSVELNDQLNTFEIIVKNTTDNPFLQGSTKVEIGFCLCNNKASYTNKDLTAIENMALDTVFMTTGAAAANGYLHGSYEQVFKLVSATVIDSATLKISGTINFKTQLVARLFTVADPKYLIYVITQDHSKTSSASDKVCLLADINTFFLNYEIPGLITFGATLIPHNDISELGAVTHAFPTDEIIFLCRIALNSTLVNDIKKVLWRKLSVRIYAQNAADETKQFDLELYDLDLTGINAPNGIPFIDINQNRNYNLTLNDSRRLIDIFRRTDLDLNGVYYWDVKYPFLFRWEYWVAKTGVNAEFFNIALPNNGQNEDWYFYSKKSPLSKQYWQIYVDCTIEIESNEVVNSGVTTTPTTVTEHTGATIVNPPIINIFP